MEGKEKWMNSVTFHVPGKPQGKARAKTVRNKHTGNTMSYTPETDLLYENYIKDRFLNKCNGMFLERGKPVTLRIVARFLPPKSTSKKRTALMLDGKELPLKKPDIDNIVKRMGGRVVEDYLLDGFSDGKIRKLGEDNFEISVSPFQSNERRNFTIAHELGHLFLNMGFETNDAKWTAQNVEYYRNGNSDLEYQANEFAAAFLMPKDEDIKIMDENTVGDMVNTTRIAEYFHVSTEAAANRGKWLGYLKW